MWRSENAVLDESCQGSVQAAQIFWQTACGARCTETCLHGFQADLYPTENGASQYGGIIGTMDL